MVTYIFNGETVVTMKAVKETLVYNDSKSVSKMWRRHKIRFAVDKDFIDCTSKEMKVEFRKQNPEYRKMEPHYLLTFSGAVLLLTICKLSTKDSMMQLCEAFNVEYDDSTFIVIEDREVSYHNAFRIAFEGICEIEAQVNFDPYRVDFYIEDYNVIIEIDGPEHKTGAKFKADAIRDKYIIENFGATIVRIPDDTTKMKAVNMILRAIANT